jgi:geranylgeranyl diphosphate synthase type II
MVGGQMDDLSASEGAGDVAWLQSLHSRKTGALLTVSLRLGGLIADADDVKMKALTAYGKALGLAFQIADDLLDAVGNAENTGKGVQKDQEAGKLTYPLLLGVEESRRRARELADVARDSLRPLGPAASRLAALADFVVERDR